MTKYVPDGKFLLDKVKVKSDNKHFSVDEISPYIRQVPNFKMFGLYKTQLHLYSLSRRDSSWLSRHIRKLGEAPVLLDTALVSRSAHDIRQMLVNRGYMNAEVVYKIKKVKKRADVEFFVETNRPYVISGFTQTVEDSAIDRVLRSDYLRNSYIKKGIYFDSGLLDKERVRITDILRNRGYYGFNKDYISYVADTTVGDHKVDLNLSLLERQDILPNGIYTELSHNLYYIDKVKVYLDYDPLKIYNINSYVPSDSIVSGGNVIYYRGHVPSVKQGVLLKNLYLIPGKKYSQNAEQNTYSSYSALQAFNNVSLQYREFSRNDSSLLDCYILSSFAKKQSVTYSLEGTNTAGDFGFASSLDYSHRNLFRGSEGFNFKLRGAYEAISSLSNRFLELSAETSINVPSFQLPFLSSEWKKKLRTTTEYYLSYDYQTRPEYDRTMLSGGLRYLWQNRENKDIKHRFDLININYAFTQRMDSAFASQLPANAKLFGYSNQFIVGMRYTYTHSNFDPFHKNANAHTLRFSLESSGNIMYALSKIMGLKKDSKGLYEWFGSYFAQFVKGDIDYSRNIYLDNSNSIAWRVGFGIGVPYGNSKELPFEERYYSGGANSVRAWNVRALGPGSYRANDSTLFSQQAGDIKLNLNLEYRTHLFWKFDTAAFIDAGNIWTIKNYAKQEGGVFKFNEFYKQIAVGYGMGLRMDFSYFLIRFDFGLKAYDPAQTGNAAWAILKPNFNNNFAWHIAVGYPF